MTQNCPVCQSPVPAGAESCPVCGFKFQGATQKFIPVAIEAQAAADDAPSNFRGVLRIMRGRRAGTSFPLGEEPLSIGRHPNSGIFLNDMTVSRLHATVEKMGGAYIIRDENSYNGVWVNNATIEEKVLRPGDIIQIGSYSLLYEEEEA